MYRRFLICFFSLLLLAGLTGCRTPPATPVAQATLPPTAVNTNTPQPPTETATAVPSDTPAPTETAVPTETASPTSTNTATATATNTATTTPTATAVPPTATSAPVQVVATVPPPPPPVVSGPAPSGPNLLANPGFELAGANWVIREGASIPFRVHLVESKPHFVRSGNQSALFLGQRILHQAVSGVTPGTTYRAGVWVKIWSSSGSDYLVSENPGDFMARICLNIAGDDDPRLPTSVCSAGVRPLDVWQYISVDGVAQGERITVMLQSYFSGPNRPQNNEAIWDDAALGLAPTAATATPPPAGPPTVPNPVPFSAQAMRSSMANARSMLEQMGGLLDRLYAGSRETCGDYQGYYRNLVQSARYDGVPGEWQGIYNEYVFAVENGRSTNQPIFELCERGGGGITALNYGIARTGINDSLNRLIPAIEAANGLP